MGTARLAGALALAAAVTMGVVPAAWADGVGTSTSSTTSTPGEAVRAATTGQSAAVASSAATAEWARLAREASAADPGNLDKTWDADATARLAVDAAAYADLATATLDYVTTAAAHSVAASTPEDAAAFVARAALFARFTTDFARQVHACEADAELIGR